KFVEYEHGRIYRERAGFSKINPSTPSFREISEEEAMDCIFEHDGFVFELSSVSEADFSKENTYYLSKDKLRFPLSFRHPEVGEKMKPLGMKQSKKLSDIMIDEKWTQIAKAVATVVADQEKICALVNFRISEEIKLEKDTKNILQISFKHYLVRN
ncbi:MAG: tRNA lysidine(34) synthetase TilS, partial [Bacteroidota bacterium]